MLGLKRVMCLAAMLAIAPAGLMACNEEEEEHTDTDASVGDDAGSEASEADAGGSEADAGAETDAGIASELAE